jgi:hypothetical protein
MMTPRSYQLATTITHLAITNFEVNECRLRQAESRNGLLIAVLHKAFVTSLFMRFTIRNHPNGR